MKLAPLALLFFAGAAASADILSFDMPRPDGRRRYLMTITEETPAARRPLIVLLHGHSGTAKQLLGQGIGEAPLSVWLDIADREGLMIIAPEGARGSDEQQGWNDCRAEASSNPRSNDVGFIRALIDKAIAEQQADPQRVYVMGMSNGGMMAYRLAAEMPEKLAAIATVGASMAAKSQCKEPKTKLSVLVIAGDADPLVPYAGGQVSFFSKTHGSVVPIDRAVEIWRELAGLPEKPTTTSTFKHRDPRDKTSAKRMLWGADPKSYQVELIRVAGGGHVEPSISKRIGPVYRGIVGPQNGDFESAEVAWAFFKEKKNPAAAPAP